MDSLILPDVGKTLPGEIGPTYLELRPDLTLDEWAQVGSLLKYIARGIQWWAGDWLAYGEDNYGEEMWQYLDRSDKTLANWASTCRKIPPERRRNDVSYSVHAEVTRLSAERQEKVLKRAAQEELTVLETREVVAQEQGKALEEEFGPAQEVGTVVCPRCQGTGEVPAD